MKNFVKFAFVAILAVLAVAFLATASLAAPTLLDASSFGTLSLASVAVIFRPATIIPSSGPSYEQVSTPTVIYYNEGNPVTILGFPVDGSEDWRYATSAIIIYWDDNDVQHVVEGNISYDEDTQEIWFSPSGDAATLCELINSAPVKNIIFTLGDGSTIQANMENP